MSHLGERLTALIDGELSDGERDKALNHLAGCEECRAEADRMRGLKRRLRTLPDVMPSSDLMDRLYGLGELGEPLPPRVRRLPGQARQAAIARPGDNRPSRRTAAVRGRLPRPRYLVAGATTLAVFGVGTAAFAVGSDHRSLPRVSPAVEQFAVEHAVTSGDVPLTDPNPSPAEKATENP